MLNFVRQLDACPHVADLELLGGEGRFGPQFSQMITLFARALHRGDEIGFGFIDPAPRLQGIRVKNSLYSQIVYRQPV